MRRRTTLCARASPHMHSQKYDNRVCKKMLVRFIDNSLGSSQTYFDRSQAVL